MYRVISTILFIFSLFSIILYAQAYCKKCKAHIANSPPRIQTPPNSELLKDNKNISDLYLIAAALEKYKTDHKAYPISENGGKSWNRSSRNNEAWIKELYPYYMQKIPIDPRLSNNQAEQYSYISNGANYKLIVNFPNDCRIVKKIQPKLIAPIGDCLAYGFWTSEQSSRW